MTEEAKPTAPTLTAEFLQATAALGHAVDPTNGPIMHCSNCKENAGDIVTLNLDCPPKDREAITAPANIAEAVAAAPEIPAVKELRDRQITILEKLSGLGHFIIFPNDGADDGSCTACGEKAERLNALNQECAKPAAVPMAEKVLQLGHDLIWPQGEKKAYCRICSEHPDDIIARDLKCSDAAPPAVPTPKDLRLTPPVLGHRDQLTLERRFRERERAKLVLENTALRLSLARVEAERTMTELQAEIMRLGIDPALDFDVDDEGKVSYVENQDEGKAVGTQRENGGGSGKDRQGRPS